MPPSADPPLRDVGAFAQRGELLPRYRRIDLAVTREGPEPTVGAGDDAVLADESGEPLDALSDQLGRLEVVRAGIDQAGSQDLAAGVGRFPHDPLVLVARVGGLKQDRRR